MKRALVLLAAVLIQTCLGGVYGWSTFVPALREEFGFSTGQTQIVFGLTIASFTVAMVLAGRLMAQWGPRIIGLIGGILFAAGYLLAARSTGDFPHLIVGIGLVAGASIGFGYVAALTTGVQWFPRHKGLVAGVAVAGFGAGAILLSSLVPRLLRDGWPVLEIFRGIGWTNGLVVCTASLFLFRPPRTEPGMPDAVAPQNLHRSPLFRSLIVGIFSGTFAGLLVISNLTSIGMDAGLTADAANLAIGFFAIGNAAGRIGWGWISDRVGYRAIPLSLLLLGAVLGLLLGARSSPVGFPAASLLAGFGFGACFVLYAAQVASHFGAGAVARIYPLVFLAYGLAGATGPWMGGYLFDVTSGYDLPFTVAMVILGIGAWHTSRTHRALRPGPVD